MIKRLSRQIVSFRAQTFNSIFLKRFTTMESRYVRNSMEIDSCGSDTVNYDSENRNDVNRKIINVSVIGEPNSGKSTFINAVVGARVSIVTNVPHTTRRSLAGIYTEGNTQIVISDTPGVVNYEEGRRLKMDRLQIKNPSMSSEESDLIAVLVDVSKKKTRERIHDAILQILHDNSHIPSILVLNKIDLVRRKGLLLTLSHDLLKDRFKDVYGYLDTGGYSKFSHVFMVSSLTSDGIPDVRNYMKAAAKPGNWHFSEDVQMDCSVEAQVTEIVREKILQLFEKEIPWQFKQDTVALDQYPNGTIRICKKLTWPKESQKRYVETKLESLHDLVVKDLENLFGGPVELILSIGANKRLMKGDIFS